LSAANRSGAYSADPARDDQPAGPPHRPGIQQRWQQRGIVSLPGGDQDPQRPPTALDA
jgi:hypothetical protein